MGSPTPSNAFQKGNPGGPGRGKGNRFILTEKFLLAMREDFEKNGLVAIERMRQDNPSDYVKVVAGLLAKTVETEDGQKILGCVLIPAKVV
jgi:hypothetical protein